MLGKEGGRNMRRVYIAHPLRGERLDIAEVEQNVSRVTELCRRVAEAHPDVLILSPIHQRPRSSTCAGGGFLPAAMVVLTTTISKLKDVPLLSESDTEV